MLCCTKWDPSRVLDTSPLCGSKYAIIILNRPLTQKAEFLKKFWNNASVRITVDGGTSRWDTFLSKLTREEQTSLKPPDLITGDFDSITPDLMQKYEKKGCKIVHTPDEDATDYTKAVIVLNEYCNTNNIQLDSAIAICQSSGRLDHILGVIQTLYLTEEKTLLNPLTRLYNLSDDELSWLLIQGAHVIDVASFVPNDDLWCSLVPVGEKCASVSSSGLKWNLDNTELRYGKLISTSNKYGDEDTIRISCDSKLLWTMRIPDLVFDGS